MELIKTTKRKRKNDLKDRRMGERMKERSKWMNVTYVFVTKVVNIALNRIKLMDDKYN